MQDRLTINSETKSIKVPRILLLDDESEIVDLCARVLRSSYLVVKTSSPFEAVSFMDSGRSKIDLVICDYNMPGMNGSEFLEQIRKIGIHTPVLLYTGQILNDRELAQFARVLLKPFDSQQLKQEVSTMLAMMEKDVKAHKKFTGIKPRLEMSMENLRAFLERRGVCDPSSLDPEQAMKILGPGEAYTIYLSWLYLHELSSKIED